MATNLLDLAGYVQKQGEMGRQERVRDVLTGAAQRGFNAESTADRRAAVSDAIAADADAGFALAGQLGTDEERQGRSLYNMARGLKQIYGRDPEGAKAFYEQQLVPGLRRLGFQVQNAFDPKRVLPVVDQVLAQFDPVGATGTPTAVREFEFKAKAAGLVPGTPEYEEAANIALGRVGRAATGGFTFGTVKGADGRERQARQNPRNGVTEIFDETVSNWVPLGGAAALNAGFSPSPGAASAPQQPTQTAPLLAPTEAEPAAVAPAATARIAITGASPGENAAILSAVQAMEAANVPRAAIDAYVAGQESRFATPAAAAPVAAPASAATRPALGVSRTPEEQAAATTAATEAAQLKAYTDATDATVDRERRLAEAKAQADAAAAAQGNTPAQREAAAAARAKLPQLNAVDRGVTRIANALAALQANKVAGTGPLDQFVTGKTPEGQELSSAVAAIQTPLLALTRVPGVGSQSDLEARLAAFQFPNLGADEAVNANTLRDLRALVTDLKTALGTVAAGGGSAPAASPPEATATNPRTGEKIELRNGVWGPAR